MSSLYFTKCLGLLANSLANRPKFFLSIFLQLLPDGNGVSNIAASTQTIFNMAAELKEVADLITANTIFCTKSVLTSDEAARYLGVTKSCLYKWTMDRVIPHYKPTGKMCYFDRVELENWLRNNRIATHEEMECKAQSLIRRAKK